MASSPAPVNVVDLYANTTPLTAAMKVAIVAGSRGQHRPTEQEVRRAGGRFIDEHLNLHVDPAVVSSQTFDVGNGVEAGAIGLHQDNPPTIL